jgi:hypothetical protein
MTLRTEVVQILKVPLKYSCRKTFFEIRLTLGIESTEVGRILCIQNQTEVCSLEVFEGF